jgi:hypothetical protein
VIFATTNTIAIIVLGVVAFGVTAAYTDPPTVAIRAAVHGYQCGHCCPQTTGFTVCEGSNKSSFDTQIDSTNSGGFADANPVLIAIIEVRIFI